MQHCACNARRAESRQYVEKIDKVEYIAVIGMFALFTERDQRIEN